MKRTRRTYHTETSEALRLRRALEMMTDRLIPHRQRTVLREHARHVAALLEPLEAESRQNAREFLGEMREARSEMRAAERER